MMAMARPPFPSPSAGAHTTAIAFVVTDKQQSIRLRICEAV
uniref:Uncharacterized protein n=1 Tax=Arundo donax TaxID=35708 RepID=A0A0A9AG58_ARUDO